MATTVLESEKETNNSPTNSPRDELADDVSHEVEALDTTQLTQEDIREKMGDANTSMNELAAVSNSPPPDSNPSAEIQNQLSGDGKGLRKFLSSAKERFDNVEPGWAQRRTNAN
jgi:uncharacterized protein YoxC